MIDRVDIEVEAGRGGDGAVSFRREKFVPRGGPDGGDGGRGGHVVLVASKSVSTLRDYHDGRLQRAEDGVRGGPSQKRGASGKTIELRVPAGSIVYDLDTPEGGDPLADLTHEGMAVVVARGGRGGWGNKRFATSTRQSPHFSQRGQQGEHRRLRVELKLLADVGIVGLPNAGKSTLLRAWSAATPKVGDYPFTTLEPELGVVSLGYDSFVAADMPGLIEGASAGAGLGHEFLRHIERTRVLVHVLDLTREDPLADRALIDAELEAFGHGLAHKPQLLALNKIDHPDARAHLELLGEAGVIEGSWTPISGLTGEGTRELAQRAYAALQAARDAEARDAAEVIPVLRPAARRERFTLEPATAGADGDAAPVVVRGGTPEWLAQTLDLDNPDARYEFFERVRKLGVHRALQRRGVRPGDRVRVGEVELTWED